MGYNLRELKWWCSPEFEMKLSLSTLVNINDGSLALADFNTGHLVDSLRDVLVRFASATSTIAHSGDGKDTRPFCDTTEICGPRCCLSLRTIEAIEDIKGPMARERERKPLPNAIVGLGFERNNGWNIGNCHPHRRRIKFTDSLATARVTNFVDANDMLAKIQMSSGNSKVVSVRVDIRNCDSFRLRLRVMFDVDLQGKRRDTLQRDWKILLTIDVLFAETVDMTWRIKPCGRERIDLLSNH